MTRLKVMARRPGVDLRAGAGAAFGSFGELLQGVLAWPTPAGPDDDVHFLVTFPVDRGSRARFRLDPGGELRVFPSHKWKARTLARALMDASGWDGGGTLIVDSELPVGKGLASSSADLVATARAVGEVLGLELSPGAIEDWLRPIEPTDGVMYPGVVAFEHRRVRLRSWLGRLPPVTVVAVDEGGQVDTVAFNAGRQPPSAARKQEYARLLDRLSAAVARADLAEVGAVATRSAELNQELLPKRQLAALLAIRERHDALGVICAHSGTVIGVLLDDEQPGHRARLAAVRSACAKLYPNVLEFHSYTFD
jgi:uncharacterized protein involved in propanediol utilization